MPLSPGTQKFLLETTLFIASQVGLYYGFKWVLRSMDPTRQKREEARKRSAGVFGRLGRGPLELTEHEQIVAAEVIHPDDLAVSFADVAGLDETIESLRETVIFPLRFPQLYDSVGGAGLMGPPKGVLLHGPPGCGKTMLAQALAKESGATFINLHVSTLTEKWFGESQKLVHALFSLARKLEPTIIFIDEIDSFLRERRSHDHEATSMMKAEFMSLWDGLTSGGMRVLVLGATNRPDDIDRAILRRMPRRYAIAEPGRESRRAVLELLLRNVRVDAAFSLDDLVGRTAGLSGSALKEMCRDAVMQPMRELIRAHRHELQRVQSGELKPRALRLSDFAVGDAAATSDAVSADAGGDRLQAALGEHPEAVLMPLLFQMQQQLQEVRRVQQQYESASGSAGSAGSAGGDAGGSSRGRGSGRRG